MVEMKNITSVSGGKDISEKAFIQSITISIFGIIFCMIALCSTTWAWCSDNISSSFSVIKAGNCEVTVSVSEKNADDTLTSIYPDAVNSELYTFEKDKTYVISITSVGTASSYCKLEINGEEYYTQQISSTESGNTISFELTFDRETKVKVLTRWGIYISEQRDFIDGQSYKNPSKETE